MINSEANKTNTDLNVAILSWWRSGTNLLAAYFNEHGWLYFNEPYSMLREYLTKPYQDVETGQMHRFTNNITIFEKWLEQIITTSRSPSCIKVQLPNLFHTSKNLGEVVANKKVLDTCFPQSIILYRKNVFDLLVSHLLADVKRKWVMTAQENLEKDIEYMAPVKLDLKLFKTSAEHAYEYWSDLLSLPHYDTEKQIYLLHSDVSSLPVKTFKKMPPKKDIIENYDELKTYYDNKYLDLFKSIDAEIESRRNRSYENWIALKKKVESYSLEGNLS